MRTASVHINPHEIAAFSKALRPLFGRLLSIGVTGTKGKTSTVEFLAELINASGRTAATLSTLGNRIGKKRYPPCQSMRDVWDFMGQCMNHGVDSVIVELTSHALSWNLHRCLELDCAILTNIGWDHIRSHGNRRNYVRIKARLFRDLHRNKKSRRPWAILNADDPSCASIITQLDPRVRIVTYGVDNGSTKPQACRIVARQVRCDFSGSRFEVSGFPQGVLPCRTSLHGNFNIYNVLAAATCAVMLGEDAEQVMVNIAGLRAPEGRFEIIQPPCDSRPAVVVDYAHTPESIRNVLETAKSLIPGGSVCAVFGCGGDCYKRKRPEMGAVAAALADRIVLTSDNPRCEDPKAIVRNIFSGIPLSQRQFVHIELDRALAIDFAVRISRSGDMVLLLGKGAESTQLMANMHVPFSDSEVALRSLRHHFGSKEADYHS